MKYLVVLLFLLAATIVCAEDYPVASISESLKTDAYAVVRESEEQFVQTDLKNGVYRIKKVITILNEKGKDAADVVIYQDHFRELKNFSAEIMLSSGKVWKKIGKKDLVTTAFSSELATDGKYSFYNFYSSGYPYTVKYEYEIKFVNGILSYPFFHPFEGYNVAVEKANYRLQIPADYTLRYKSMGNMPSPDRTLAGKDSVFSWQAAGLPALISEPYMPPYKELFPTLYLSPARFCVDNVCGDMSSWVSFGKWQEQLLTGRDVLPPAMASKIKELTNDAPDTKEKIKRIYEYLQQTTRYVSIQLGIGGWQPMPAEMVAKTGFGDCKALSNYMRAMLKLVDIPSYYIVISMNNKRFFPDFPSFSQANHVILMVPQENDSIWLECTSQYMPFGYIHRSIAGHDALAVGDDRSFFCTLPDYPGEQNQIINVLDMNIETSGTAKISVRSDYRMKEYEKTLAFLRSNDPKEQSDWLIRNLSVQKPMISDVQKQELKSEYPAAVISYHVTGEDYAAKTSSRLFIPINPLRIGFRDLFPSASRRYDIQIEQEIVRSDSITIHIPEGYEVETLPKTTLFNSPYGLFLSTISKTQNDILYVQQMEVRKGTYPVAQYGELKSFFNQLSEWQGGRITLKKNKAI